MALLIQTNGQETFVRPKSGRLFTIEELNFYVDGYIEMVPMAGGVWMVLNEDGKGLGKPVNFKATAITRDILHPSDIVVGDVLLCSNQEVD